MEVTKADTAPEASVKNETSVNKGFAIKGRVLGENSEALKSAEISLKQKGITTRTTRSDENGAFQIQGLDDAEADVEVRAWGYQIKRVKAESSLEIQLDKGAVIEGEVIGISGETLKGVKVKIAKKRDNNRRYSTFFGITKTTATSDDHGRFAFANLDFGKYRIGVNSDQGVADMQFIEASSDNPNHQLRFMLQAGLVITGYVRDENSTPLVKVKVSARSTKSRGIARKYTLSDEQGRFRFDNLAQGSYRLGLDHPEYYLKTHRVVPAGKQEVELRAQRAKKIIGKVTTPDGKATDFQVFTLRKRFNHEQEVFKVEKKDMRFSFFLKNALRRQKEIVLRVKAKGYSPGQSQVISVDTYQGEEIPISLKANRRLSLFVKSPRSVPLLGVKVYMKQNQSVWRRPESNDSVETDDRGKAVLDGLTPGKVQIYIVSKNYAITSLNREISQEDERWEETLKHGGVIKGKVTNASGEAVAGREIELRSKNRYAWHHNKPMVSQISAEGTYQMDRVPPGKYTIRLKQKNVSSFGSNNGREVSVEDGKEVEVDFGGKSLESMGSIDGVLADKSMPIRRLLLFSSGSYQSKTTLSARVSEEGSFKFDLVEEGKYVIMAMTREGYRFNTPVDVKKGEVTKVELKLPEGRVSGRVNQVDGSPMERGQAILLKSGLMKSIGVAQWFKHTVASSRIQGGEYLIKAVPAGEYDLLIAQSYGSTGTSQPYIRRGVVVSSEEVSIDDIQLAPSSFLSGRVSDESGEPIKGAGFTMIQSDGSVFFSNTRYSFSDKDGKFRLSRPDNFPFTLHVEAKGYSRQVLQVGVEEIQVTLTKGAKLNVQLEGSEVDKRSLVLCDKNKKPLTEVMHRGNIRQIHRGGYPQSDEEGRATLENIAVGEYTLLVQGKSEQDKTWSKPFIVKGRDEVSVNILLP